MIVADALVKADATFTDRGSRSARVTLRYPASLSNAQIETAFLNLLALAAALSNAIITEAHIIRAWREQDSTPPDTASDVKRKVALFYRNEGVYDGLWLPSPPDTLFEDTGTYAGIRVASSDPSIELLLTALTSALPPAVTPALVDWGEYVVGGLAL